MERRADERDMEARPGAQKETRSALRHEASAERLAETPTATPTTPPRTAGGSQGDAGLTRTTRRDDGGTAGEGTRTRAGTTAGEGSLTPSHKPHLGEEHGERPSGVPSAPHPEGTHGTRTSGVTTGEPVGTGSATGAGSPLSPGNATGTGTGTRPAQHRGTPGAGADGSGVQPVLAHSESDGLAQRLQHAVSGFVDSPRAAVEEADALFEEAAARLTESLAERRRLLRSTWLDKAPTGEDGATEELRTALRDYRNAVQHLLKV